MSPTTRERSRKTRRARPLRQVYGLTGRLVSAVACSGIQGYPLDRGKGNAAETREPLDGCSTFRSNRRSAVTWPNGSTNRSTSFVRRAEAISRHLGALRPESIGGVSDNSDPVANKDSVRTGSAAVQHLAGRDDHGFMNRIRSRDHARNYPGPILFRIVERSCP